MAIQIVSTRQAEQIDDTVYDNNLYCFRSTLRLQQSPKLILFETGQQRNGVKHQTPASTPLAEHNFASSTCTIA